MDGLTAKVFRTYNASITLQEQLDKLTNRENFLILLENFNKKIVWIDFKFLIFFLQ